MAGDLLVKVDHKPSSRFAEYIRKIACDQWECAGASGNDKAILRHRETGQTVAYNLHDGGNDWNGPRNFALDVQRLCGCQLIEPRGRKKSRKSVRPSGFTLSAAPAVPAVGEIDELNAKHEAQREEWLALIREGGRNAASRARVLLQDVAVTEKRLRALHQPVEEIR